MLENTDFSIYDGKSPIEITMMLTDIDNQGKITEIVEILKRLKILPGNYSYLAALIIKNQMAHMNKQQNDE